jgi:hypothetical protein
MQTLIKTLSEYDLELLRIIANRWDVDLGSRDVKEAATRLAAAMLQPDKVNDLWGRLPDDQRSTLQALLAAKGKMPAAFFTRVYGAIRLMGPDRLAREKPYLNPANTAEALYFRGLIASTFAETDKGSQAVVYIPTDLAALLPAHLTGYVLEPQREPVPPLPEPENIRLADTALVDDLTTLLACCQIEDIPLAENTIPPDFRGAIKPYLLGSGSAARFGLMVALALDLGLMAPVGEPEQFLKPVAEKARRWLDSPRPAQVHALAEAWRDSVTFNELWYTPGIKPERAGWQNDPLLARQTILNSLEMVPPNGWWQTAELLETVKEEEPDFQRPNGDYESWYIRDAQTNEYLRGFESWDKVDGALLRFLIVGPMHGLGLVDLAGDSAACRLTAYGRALIDLSDWPAPTAPEASPIKLYPDGLCEVPRSTNRYERFQLARFTEWVTTGDPYQYRVTANGLELAKRQGISAERVLTFLGRLCPEGVPDSVVRQIELWGKAGAEPATIEHLTVLRVPTPELLTTIMSTPALRRYLGAPLGPTAVIVRGDQWAALVSALRESGIAVETNGGEGSESLGRERDT